MCGIVGYTGPREAGPILIAGLQRLEYRGYDSAGIALVDEAGDLFVEKKAGKLANLQTAIADRTPHAVIGLAHTRWATHGRPNDLNAHPHQDCTGEITVIHNGIIENFRELREGLVARGHTLTSETDTEALAHLIEEAYDGDLADAVRAALRQAEGAYAIAAMHRGEGDRLVGARQDVPLVVGLADGEAFLASDVAAILAHTNRVIFLQEGDVADLHPWGVTVTGVDGEPRERPVQVVDWTLEAAEKGGYDTFMLKEIHEQPAALAQSLLGRVGRDDRIGLAELDPLLPVLRTIRRVELVACGTAYYAGLVAKYWFERFARLPVEIDVASEFRYREAPFSPGNLAVFVSQSGETADTLATLRYAKEQKQHVLSIVNVPTSTIARESDVVIPTLAGPEIGVASTKAFTCQLAALLCLAIAAGRIRGVLSDKDERNLVRAMIEVPRHLSEALRLEPQIEALARDLAKSKDVLYLGRGTAYPIALEGALKLKEISYIHAEGYAAGELKHGPIALIDESMPVVVVAPFDKSSRREGVFEKTVSNMQEVAARGGKIILITDPKGAAEASALSLSTLVLPDMANTVTPIVYAIPVQLIAYHTAVNMGTDVDQPRNLAKSVTVE